MYSNNYLCLRSKEVYKVPVRMHIMSWAYISEREKGKRSGRAEGIGSLEA
jgi:hypothetical protein